MTMIPSVDRETFLANVRHSGLVSEAQLAELAPQLPDTPRGRLVARALVELGVLTRFQAERLLIGRIAGFLLGQYKILDEIGRGGMGRVFKAEHQTMKRLVALKVLAPEVLSTERAQELFLREVRVVAQLAHPNIVTAFDASAAGGRFYLVLEYVDGPNLEQLVRKQGPLSVGLACDYIAQVASGLQCAHQLGMVHRDIKPANILVQRRGLSDDSPGLIKISDFGLARLQMPNVDLGASHGVGTILTRENTVMGTPDFLSPEQSRNLHKTDIRSDIYSLGCTLYYLLTGKVPFPGGKTLDKLIRHSTDTPKPLSEFRSDVPAPVLAILDKMLSKHPDDRFQTPTELAAALEPYAVSGPIPWAPPPSAVPLNSLPESGPEAGGEPEVGDDLSALANTIPSELGLTPVPMNAPVSSRRLAMIARRARAKKRLFYWSLGLVAGISLLLAGVALALILRYF
jgi:serine/threonine-protein kinase